MARYLRLDMLQKFQTVVPTEVHSKIYKQHGWLCIHGCGVYPHQIPLGINMDILRYTHSQESAHQIRIAARKRHRDQEISTLQCVRDGVSWRLVSSIQYYMLSVIHRDQEISKRVTAKRHKT